MITTELENIQGLISSNRKLSVGMDFLRLMRTEGLLEANKGLFPAILGGAVRDGLFLGREINDIDVFLFYDQRSALTTSPLTSRRERSDAMADVRQNILAWLEDMEIEWQSLLSDRASAYFGQNQFHEIIQFVWRETTIQVMIPNGESLNSSIDGLMRTMPLYSTVALTLNYLRVYDLALANFCMPRNHYFVGTEKDIPYLRNKAPTGVFIPVSNTNTAISSALNHYVEASSSLDALNVNNGASMGVNAMTSLLKRAFLDRIAVGNTDRISQSTANPTHTL